VGLGKSCNFDVIFLRDNWHKARKLRILDRISRRCLISVILWLNMRSLLQDVVQGRWRLPMYADSPTVRNLGTWNVLNLVMFSQDPFICEANSSSELL
jgi:hypothetical protein